MLHVSNHADDFAHLVACLVRGETRFDPLANNILSWEIFLGEALVHNNNWRGIKLFSLIERSPLPHRNTGGFEVIRANDPRGRRRPMALRLRIFFYVEVRRHVAATQWQGNNQAR